MQKHACGSKKAGLLHHALGIVILQQHASQPAYILSLTTRTCCRFPCLEVVLCCALVVLCHFLEHLLQLAQLGCCLHVLGSMPGRPYSVLSIGCLLICLNRLCHKARLLQLQRAGSIRRGEQQGQQAARMAAGVESGVGSMGGQHRWTSTQGVWLWSKALPSMLDHRATMYTPCRVLLLDQREVPLLPSRA